MNDRTRQGRAPINRMFCQSSSSPASRSQYDRSRTPRGSDHAALRTQLIILVQQETRWIFPDILAGTGLSGLVLAAFKTGAWNIFQEGDVANLPQGRSSPCPGLLGALRSSPSPKSARRSCGVSGGTSCGIAAVIHTSSIARRHLSC